MPRGFPGRDHPRVPAGPPKRDCDPEQPQSSPIGQARPRMNVENLTAGSPTHARKLPPAVGRE